MLTNTTTDMQDMPAIAAATIAIDEAERRHEAGLREIAQLLNAGAIEAGEAAALEAETRARFVGEAHELERQGVQHCAPARSAAYERHAADPEAQATVERLRSPLLHGLTKRTRVLRERQMAVVASARVDASPWRLVIGDEDTETLGVRHDLAAAGLL